jgi:hypothetical protein
MRLEDCDTELFEYERHAWHPDVGIWAFDTPGALRFTAVFDVDRFPPATISDILARLESLMLDIVERPDASVRE